jgi:hypothetical protein
MALPIIDSVTPAGPVSLTPGQSVDFTVVAHDPDTRSGAATFNVTDSGGNNATPVTITVAIADNVTITATCDVGVIVPKAGTPGVFTLTIPV